MRQTQCDNFNATILMRQAQCDIPVISGKQERACGFKEKGKRK